MNCLLLGVWPERCHAVLHYNPLRVCACMWPSLMQEKLDDYPEDEIYFIIDCPGQIELYTHLRPINIVLEEFKSREYSCCSLCLVDSTFVTETPKFISVSSLSR